MKTIKNNSNSNFIQISIGPQDRFICISDIKEFGTVDKKIHSGEDSYGFPKYKYIKSYYIKIREATDSKIEIEKYMYDKLLKILNPIAY